MNPNGLILAGLAGWIWRTARQQQAPTPAPRPPCPPGFALRDGRCCFAGVGGNVCLEPGLAWTQVSARGSGVQQAVERLARAGNAEATLALPDAAAAVASEAPELALGPVTRPCPEGYVRLPLGDCALVAEEVVAVGDVGETVAVVGAGEPAGPSVVPVAPDEVPPSSGGTIAGAGEAPSAAPTPAVPDCPEGWIRTGWGTCVERTPPGRRFIAGGGVV